jgi:CBS domain containing-hemolysin-like protein
MFFRPRVLTLLSLLALLAPATARASFLSGDALDTAADWIAILVLVVVPAVVIVVFWLIHILPEKIAEKRHHPQKSAINTLCLLSLFFGGLLWPLAWLWAYTRPVAYRMAYGTDKHEDYFTERGEKARTGDLVAADIDRLRGELDEMAKRGQLPEELAALRAELDALRAARDGGEA